MWTSGNRILNFALLHLSGKCSHSNTKLSDLGIDHPDPNIMPVYAFQTSCIAQSPSGLKAIERMNVWKSAACSRAIAKLLSISSYLFTSPSNNEKAAEKKCRCWKRFGVCSLLLLWRASDIFRLSRSKPLAGPPSQWCRSDPVRRVQYCDVTSWCCWDISGAGDTTCRALLFASPGVTKPWSFQRVRGPWRWNLGALLLHPARRWIAAPVKNEQTTHQDRHHQASPSTECATNSWTKKYHKELGHTRTYHKSVNLTNPRHTLPKPLQIQRLQPTRPKASEEIPDAESMGQVIGKNMQELSRKSLANPSDLAGMHKELIKKQPEWTTMIYGDQTLVLAEDSYHILSSRWGMLGHVGACWGMLEHPAKAMNRKHMPQIHQLQCGVVQPELANAEWREWRGAAHWSQCVVPEHGWRTGCLGVARLAAWESSKALRCTKTYQNWDEPSYVHIYNLYNHK